MITKDREAEERKEAEDLLRQCGASDEVMLALSKLTNSELGEVQIFCMQLAHALNTELRKGA